MAPSEPASASLPASAAGSFASGPLRLPGLEVDGDSVRALPFHIDSVSVRRSEYLRGRLRRRPAVGNPDVALAVGRVLVGAGGLALVAAVLGAGVGFFVAAVFALGIGAWLWRDSVTPVLLLEVSHARGTALFTFDDDVAPEIARAFVAAMAERYGYEVSVDEREVS